MQDGQNTRRDERLLAFIASIASIVAFLHYYRRDEILLYGDAVAHINIARRIFDSITPGPLQIGTVWLPLPHVLSIPFLLSDWMWRTGIGGSIVSMISYAAGTVAVYRLTRHCISRLPGTSPLSDSAREAGLLAALIYAANPNLLYLQATAMTESLYLALFIWTVVFAIEWLQAPNADVSKKKLEHCGVILAGAMLTRYDGWFLAACMGLIVVAVWGMRVLGQKRQTEAQDESRIPTRAAVEFVLLLVVVAGLWFAYNYREFGNPAEFATGPYSAREIERRTSDSFNPHYPGYDAPILAAQFFLKSAKLNVGSGRWELPLTLAALAGLVLMIAGRTAWPALLLWIPVPFYALSIAYGAVPIFLPVWWPFSYYNTRYGIELLPAIAVFTAIAIASASRFANFHHARTIFVVFAIVLTAGSYASVWRSTPVCLREAHANGDSRQSFEVALANQIQKLPRSSHLLMSTGAHPGALQRAGFPLRQVINETNHPQWEQALAAPAREADYVVALDHDDVAQASSAHAVNLTPIATLELPNSPRTTIYKSLLHGPR